MRHFTLCLFCLVSSIAISQNTDQFHYCGYDLLVQKQEETHPGYRTYLEESFEYLKKSSAHYDKDISPKIKLVVHIVYQNPTQNITDQQIESVIGQLNKDFGRTNADTSNLRPIFQDVAMNPRIQFELEEIIRVPTDTVFQLQLFGGGLPDHVKRSDLGGSDAWDVDRYLNIWICHIENGQLLGYAYPPNCAPNWPDNSTAPDPNLDGIVVHHEAFDTIGSIGISGGTEVNIKGRVLTHEVGHYLGLRHTWGDGPLSLIGLPDCNVDDGIEDTPNQGLNSNFSCDFSLNTCEDDTLDLPDMIENYMDYASEDCQNTFTKQQVAIMRSTLENCRNKLLTSSDELTKRPSNTFELYPNPASQWLTFDVSGASERRLVVDIRNLHGQKLLSKTVKVTGGFAGINIAQLPKGLYLAELTIGAQREVLRFLRQ